MVGTGSQIRCVICNPLPAWVEPKAGGASNLKAAQAVRDAKPRMSLLPAEALESIALAMTEGATRYAPWNWLTAPAPRSVYLDALDRHLSAWKRREDRDQRTGFSHLAHAGANLLILLTLEIRGIGEDDRQPGAS